MTGLDRRLFAYRPDLADARLAGRVEAERFVEGRAAEIVWPVADLRSAPDPGVGLDTQLLCGQRVQVFEEYEGWAWVQGEDDSYVGHMPAAALGEPAGEPTHRLCVPRSFTYRGPDLKLPASACHSMGAHVRVVGEATTRGTKYAVLATGEAMIEAHLKPTGWQADDYVAIAESFEHTPYLWGGTSGFGIDCSGLVQLSLRMAGIAAPRDTDMQEADLGERFDVAADGRGLKRGDLVFWKGHVAIMVDEHVAIHANGATMQVTRERLASAVERIAPLFGPPTSFRRPALAPV